MNTPVGPDSNAQDISPVSSGKLYILARQPILDLGGRVHAFQLRFRSETEQSCGGELVVRNLAGTAAFFALQKPSEMKKLTGKMTAFVSCPVEALTGQLADMLPPTLTVLEVPASVEFSPDLIEVCQQLKALGFRFALKGVEEPGQSKQMIQLADYVKVDFDRTQPMERRKLIEQLHGKTITTLALNVETQEAYRMARDEGFNLFQGYYFCQPEPMRNRRPPVNQLLRINILKALQQNPLELRRVSELVKRDGPIAYQLLRLVNSPLWAMRQAVGSIEAALLAAGDDAFRRIATMSIASAFNGNQPPELLCMAMVRARFCEVAGYRLNLDPFSQYLLGLLSLLPAMQGQQMEEIAPTLPLGDQTREALLGTRNQERVLLGWLETCERGDWAGCDVAAEAGGLNQQDLAKMYVDAVAWAESALHSSL